MYARMRRWLIPRRAHYLHPVLLLRLEADKNQMNLMLSYNDNRL